MSDGPAPVPSDPMVDAHELSKLSGTSREAAELVLDAHVIDLHLDTFIPHRLWGYDMTRPHGPGWLRGKLFGHLDLVRAVQGGLTGAMWSITTQPWATRKARLKSLEDNIVRFTQLMRRMGFAWVSTPHQYAAQVKKGRHAPLLSIQGGNALSALDGEQLAQFLSRVPLTRITLLHLTASELGATSMPALGLIPWSRGALKTRGVDHIRAMNEKRVFVDLAHIHERAFFAALEAHRPDLPPIVTHTGVRAVNTSWRNLTDRQLKAIADRGGVAGVMFHGPFLRRRRGPRDGAMVVEHLEHIHRVAGPQCSAIGSDLDGFILPPAELSDGRLAYVRLVHHMLLRRWTESQIRQTLGLNFLNSWRHLTA